MTQRLIHRDHNPAAYQGLIDFNAAIRDGGLEHSLLELVKIRASQLNGCAYCLAMHTADARAAGETDERMLLLSVWREAPIFTARERAALAMTEAVTLIANTQDVPDSIYNEAAKQFSEKELVDLVLAIIAINCWNRLQVTFRVPPDTVAPRIEIE